MARRVAIVTGKKTPAQTSIGKNQTKKKKKFQKIYGRKGIQGMADQPRA